jgi:hypothetical protein
MALTLSLIVEIFDLIQRGVDWLAGGSAPPLSNPSPCAQVASAGPGPSAVPNSASAPAAPTRGLADGQQAKRLWGGPLRLHPTRRAPRSNSHGLAERSGHNRADEHRDPRRLPGCGAQTQLRR